MSVDPDQVEDDVSSIDDPEGSKRYSYAYLSGLFAIAAIAVALSIMFGLITPNITVSANITVGWIVEYGIAGFVAIFIFFTASQVANIVGMDFIGGVAGVVARIAHNYELPNESNNDGEE